MMIGMNSDLDGPVVSPEEGRVVVIVPARAGSKGIRRKNLEPVGGIPLVLRTVRCALAAPSVDVVLVSTDDGEIAGAARGAGAGVVTRPAELGGDSVSSEAVLLHALDAAGAAEDPAGITVLLQCTSPFTRVDDLEAAIAAVRDGGADVAFTASPSHGFVWRADPTGAAVAVNHDAARRPRRQDREPEWVENGAVYALRTAGFVESGHRFFGRVVVIEMPVLRSIEIDDVDDLAAARRIAPLVDGAASAQRLAGVSAVVFDFDGVLTDNAVWTDQDGRESVRSDRSDGLGIERLRTAGTPMLVISKERNPVVAARCRKLGLDVVQGCDDKVSVMERWLADRGLTATATAYVGNDVNDLPGMARVGCAVAVADAHPDVLAAADLVLACAGGRGAVRELADALLGSRRVD